MELRHLRYFVTVAEEKHFSRASARLRISQPAVSRQIKDLEEELGVTLLHRNGHSVTLTPAGDLFLIHARELLRRSAKATAEMKAFQHHQPEKLTIGYIAPALASTLVPALRKFELIRPNIELELLELSPREQIDSLRSGQLDVAFLGNSCADVDSEFEVTVLEKTPLRAVLPDNHPMAQQKQIHLEHLSEEKFIGLSDKSFPGRNEIIYKACQSAGFTPHIRYRVDGFSAQLALVAAGKGITLASDAVSRLPHQQAVFVELKAPVPYDSSVAAHRKCHDNETLMSLVSWCRDSGQNVNFPLQP